jgi:hypothetical protein
MKKETISPPEPAAKEHKTSPRGMAPDKAHTSREATAERRNSETEEIFNNSPQNAESKQTQHVK